MENIVIASQKGGTGKTTTAGALVGLAVKDKLRVLAVDLDPQGSLTCILRGDGEKPGSYELMKGEAAEALIQPGRDKGPDLIAASLALAGAEGEFSSRPGRDHFLRKGLEPIKKNYDLIIIDTPPTLGTLLVNALTAATQVLIPVQADAFAMQSLYQLADTLGQVREYCNPELAALGVLLTRYNGRTVLSRDLRERLEEGGRALGLPVMPVAVREGVAVKEAQTLAVGLFDYEPRSKPAQDYQALWQSLRQANALRF